MKHFLHAINVCILYNAMWNIFSPKTLTIQYFILEGKKFSSGSKSTVERERKRASLLWQIQCSHS